MTRDLSYLKLDDHISIPPWPPAPVANPHVTRTDRCWSPFWRWVGRMLKWRT